MPVLYIVERGRCVMIVWYLDLLLPIQSVPITINILSLNPAQAMYSLHYVIKFVSDLRQLGGLHHTLTLINC